MDFKQLHYVIAIAEEQSIARAAERLFLSRPALNHFLLDLEGELGVKLFARHSRRMDLTYAGKTYVESAKRILGIQNQTYKTLADISGSRVGCLNVGITRGGAEMFCNVFPRFHRRYPLYVVKLLEGNVRTLEQATVDGKVDFSIIGFGSVSAPQLQHITFCPCEVVLMLPPGHPLQKSGSAPNRGPYPPLDLRLLENERFVLMSTDTNIRTIADRHFEAAGFTPHIMLECTLADMAYEMVRSGVAPSILRSMQHGERDDGVTCYSLQPRENWNLSVAFRRETVFSEAERYFIRLVEEFYTGAEVGDGENVGKRVAVPAAKTL